MNWRDRIESDPRALHGEPRVRGTRIPVSVVLNDLAARLDLQEFLASYPSLAEADVRACLAWAAEFSHTAEGAQARDGAGEPGSPGEPGGATAERASLDASPKEAPAGNAEAFWSYLMSIPNVGDDADFERPVSYGRPDIEWE
jgi:uncharacterized protein (DUF433 family)